MILSVVIVNWNTRDLLRQALQSVFENFDDQFNEIWVVDNGSTDSSVEMVRQVFPSVHLVVNSQNLGFVHANNQVLKYVNGRYVLLLNSDAAVLPGALSYMVEYMDDHPKVGMVGPKLLNHDGSFQSSFMDFPNLLSELLLMTKLSKLVHNPFFPSYPPHKSREIRSVDWILGACMLVRQETLQQIGGMDETFFMYSEEVDWCWRIKEAGWSVHYLPAAAVMHWGGQSSAKVPFKRRTIVYKSKLLFLAKHYGPFTAWLFKGALLVTSILKLMGWGALSIMAKGGDHRIHAKNNVRSYNMLIGDLIKGAV